MTDALEETGAQVEASAVDAAVSDERRALLGLIEDKRQRLPAGVMDAALAWVAGVIRERNRRPAPVRGSA